MRGKVTFDRDRCKGCGLCTSVCPKQIVVLEPEALNKKGYHPATVIEMDKCIACASCARICPDSVITVERFD